MAGNMNPHELRQLVLNFKEPLIFNNINKWKMINWDLYTWIKILNEENLTFRQGEWKYTKDPQWENSCKNVTGTIKEFFDYEKNDPSKWFYFDYKYLNEWFQNISEIKNDISWSNFGFPEYTAKDSTIWIGSKGAHTPCHIDTYGCNLITQVFGSKRWILFPPDVNLFPTRIPYEESSIYSKINFFSPDLNKCKGLEQARSVILNPGETLFVPQGWWHYVENLETAISINVWIPLPNDFEKQLEESLVQLVAFQFTNDLSFEEKAKILIKPEEAIHKSSQYSFEIIKKCIGIHKEASTKEIVTENINYNVNKYECLCKKLPVSTETELDELLKRQFERFQTSEIAEDQETTSNDFTIQQVLDAFLQPEVIGLIKNKLIDCRK